MELSRKCAKGITNSKANRKEFVVKVEQSAHEPKLIMFIKASSLRIKKNYFEKNLWGHDPFGTSSPWLMFKLIGHAIVKLLFFVTERNLTIKKVSVNIRDKVTVLGYLVNASQQVMKVSSCRQLLSR